MRSFIRIRPVILGDMPRTHTQTHTEGHSNSLRKHLTNKNNALLQSWRKLTRFQSTWCRTILGGGWIRGSHIPDSRFVGPLFPDSRFFGPLFPDSRFLGPLFPDSWFQTFSPRSHIFQTHYYVLHFPYDRIYIYIYINAYPPPLPY